MADTEEKASSSLESGEVRFGFEPSESGSDAYVTFEKAYWQVWGFLGFVIMASKAADELSTRMREIRQILHDEVADTGESSVLNTFTKTLESHYPFIRETILIRAVDNYLTYLKDILYAIYRKRPEVLRSNEMVRIDLVLEYDDMADLLDALAERKVSDLSYKSLADLSGYFKEKLGLALTATKGELEHLTLLVEIRNLLVHNRGIVNSIFLSKTKSTKWKLGQHVSFNAGDKGLMFLAGLVVQLDTEACKKFDLTQVPSYLKGL